MILKRAASIRDVTTCLVERFTTKSQLYFLFVREISMDDRITVRWSKVCFGYSLDSSRIDMAPLSPHNMCFGLNYDY